MKPAIIRNIDTFGRINIPSEIRQTMRLSTGDALEIRTVGNEIVLSKYQMFGISEPELKNFLQILYSVIHWDFVFERALKFPGSYPSRYRRLPLLPFRMTNCLQQLPTGSPWIQSSLLAGT